MDSYRVEVKAKIALQLADEDAEIGPIPTSGSGRKPEAELDYLSNIIKTFNEQFGNIEWEDADKAYQNAMRNSNKQNARIEHDKALQRVVMDLPSDHTELFKQFCDNPGFKKSLGDTIFGVTYQQQADQSATGVCHGR
jgi:type I restriction enzyme R subunit